MDSRIRAAMQGDAKAAWELTEAGVAIPCGACAGECTVYREKGFGWAVVCEDASCPGWLDNWYDTQEDALRAHNTRANLQGPNEALTLSELREMDGSILRDLTMALWCRGRRA